MTKKGSVIGISATKASAILGLKSYATQFEVWQGWIEKLHPGYNKKLGYELPVFEEGAALRWGNAFEESIIRLAEEKQGINIHSRESLFMKELNGHPSNPKGGNSISALCYIDGWYSDGPSGISNIQTLHEGKTTSYFYYKDNFGDPGTDQVPRTYQIQCQHQMICTGAEEVILSVLVFPKRQEDFEELGIEVSNKKLTINSEGEPETKYIGDYGIYKDDCFFRSPMDWAQTLDDMGYFHQYTIKADPDLHKIMIERYKAWWKKHIIEKQIPDDQNFEDIKRMIPEPVGSIIVPSHVLALIKKQKDIGQEIGDTGDLAKHRTKLKVEILKACQGLDKTLDDDSKEKWILLDEAGKKVGSFGRNEKGTLIFR